VDNSKEFQLMLDSAITQHPDTFAHFDRAKNIQSQLQEMVEPSFEVSNKQILALSEFIGFCLQYKKGRLMKFTEHIDQFITMEQLWLAVVMFFVYQKMWSNGEWITTKR